MHVLTWLKSSVASSALLASARSAALTCSCCESKCLTCQSKAESYRMKASFMAILLSSQKVIASCESFGSTIKYKHHSTGQFVLSGVVLRHYNVAI